MKDFITESEKRFNERFTEAIENIEWSWNGGEFVIDDLKTFLTTELLAAYEKGRKDLGEEVLGKVEGMKVPDVKGDVRRLLDTYYLMDAASKRGHNSALSAVVSLIRESVGEKLTDTPN